MRFRPRGCSPLDFDLRAADLFFRELVVPGLGRIWFVRQLSWPLAALALHKEMVSHGSNAPKPTAICHGIEALACKLEYLIDPDDPVAAHPRTARVRPPMLSGKVWSVSTGCARRRTDVRNTHRQAATRAIRVDGGLGFALRGSRFDLLELEPVGARPGQRAPRAARRERQDEPSQVAARVARWRPRDLRVGRAEHCFKRSPPEHPTDDERALVRSRLIGTSTSASEKRQRRLARAIGRTQTDLPSIEDGVVARLRDAGHREQANEIIVARAFGAVLDRARDAVASLTSVRSSQDAVAV